MRVHVMSLQERLAQTSPNMPHHGNARRPHAWGQAEGTTMSILFAALLEDFKQSRILDRVRAGRNGMIPRQCHELSKIHGSYSVDFSKICGVPWTELSPSAQCSKLRDFLFQKLSADPDGVHVVHAVGGKKKITVLDWLLHN